MASVRLEEFDKECWKRRVVTVGISDEGKRVVYSGEALTSVSGSDGLILEMTVESSPLRPAYLSLPVVVSTGGKIEIQIEGTLVETIDLITPSIGEAPLTRVCVDISRWSAGRRRLLIKLLFSFDRADGAIMVLLDATRQAFAVSVNQPWRWSYVTFAVAILALEWILLLAVPALVAAESPWFKEEWEQYAFATLAAAWAISILGLADAVRVGVWAFVRRIFGWSMEHPRPALAIMLTLTVAGTVVGMDVGRCILLRAHYTDHIETYLRNERTPDVLVKAFALMPGRAEARFLIELHAWRLRFDDDIFHAYVRRFVSSPDAREGLRVASAGSHKSCTYHGDENVVAPLEWYAAFMPEGEGQSETDLLKAARALLTGHPGVQAETLALTFDIELGELSGGEVGRSIRENAIAKLRRRMETAGEDARYGEFFQIGADRLGQAALETCNLDEAIRWFRAILEARRRVRSAEATIVWLRPPEKLAIYQMYLALSNIRSPSVAQAVKLLDKCPDFRGRFKAEIYEPYKAFKDLEVWTENTPFSNKLKPVNFVRTALLGKGWRY